MDASAAAFLASSSRLSAHQIVLRITPFLILFALATSVGSLVVRRLRRGRIALDAHPSAAPGRSSSPAAAAAPAGYQAVPSEDADADKAGAHDPFDLYDAEVWENGVALNEDAFWRQVRLFGRLPLLVLAGAVLSLRLAILVLPVVRGDATPPFALLSTLAAVACYTYVVALALGALPLKDVPAHWRFTLHLASLLGTATVCKALETLLPTDKADAVDSLALRVLGYAELGCLILATTIAVSIPRGPDLYFPMAKLYTPKIAADALAAEQRTGRKSNVSGESSGCITAQLLFSFGTRVVDLAYKADSFDAHDLPVVPNHMRAMPLFAAFRRVLGQTQKSRLRQRGSGWAILFKVYRANAGQFAAQAILAIITAVLYYGPAAFINRFVAYLETDPERKDPAWGWVYCFGLFVVSAANFILTGVLWSISTTYLQSRIKVQLNTTLFAKTLVRKDVASSSSGKASADVGDKAPAEDQEDDEEDVTSKSQVMTLMTVDVDRVAEFSFHTFSLIDAPIEIVVGAVFCYQLLGVSALVGLLTTCLLLPLNHLASKFVVEAQDRLMQARDERTALMNEVLQGMNMLKYMAWERSFEKRIQAIREKELRWQKRNYLIEVAFNAIWAATPAFVIVAAFTDYVWRRQMPLPPSIAFTAVAVFGELRFALNALPETFISVLQGFVSLRRIEKYLATAEVEPAAQTESGSNKIFLNSATISWPKDRIVGDTTGATTPSTPKSNFSLFDVTLDFPVGELSLICGRLGSGKTLLLLALLGEADLLAGQLVCPRSALDAMATFSSNPTEDDWIVPSVSAYVPQTAWLRNASIKDNILFGLPYRPTRYQAVLDACSLLNDLRILEDGDETEIGESGMNLSGGQKARVSLARAVYSRASLLLLDDVLAAVDAHTAKHIYHKCLKGPLMQGRTVILVSHHVQLCAPGANFVVSLDNGSISYSGSASEFLKSGVDEELLKDDPQDEDDEVDELAEDVAAPKAEEEEKAAPTVIEKRAAPRKLIEDEQRATGRISRDVWALYLKSCGGWLFWSTLGLVLFAAMLTPVLENGWLRHWSESYLNDSPSHSALYYIGIYCAVTMLGVFLGALQYYVMYSGSLRASSSIHRSMLESVLRATVRFHQTESRGRMLARFGKDMEGIDSSLPDNILQSTSHFLSIIATFVSICVIGGVPFLVAAAALGVLYYRTGSIYGQASRDMRRLDSVTRSPLYALYGEANGGVAVIRAFGAATNSLSSLFRAVDSNLTCFYWLWTLNRWLSARFNLLSSAVVGVTAAAVLVGGSSAATAGFALAFANTVPGDLLYIVRHWVATETSMVAVERVKQFSELPQERAEFVEPRPSPDWPASGKLVVQDLEIKYAPDLPTVLHKINLTVEPGTRCAIVGSTGSGKSTLALALLRLVEAHSGKILVDDVDISTIGLTDLRTRITIIPQDPTVLSGTLRSTLDPHGEYEDAAIFDALRRVHLLPAEGAKPPTPAPSVAGVEEDGLNANVFEDLDSKVSESGENFSQGEKQLICFARALLRRNKILLMDEATASIDDHSDTLVQQTLRDFSASTITIITIAHRLRTIIDFDKVVVLHEGVCREDAEPWALLQDSSSAFYALCEATGPTEFAELKRMAEEAHRARQ